MFIAWGVQMFHNHIMFSLSDILSFSFIFHLGKDANPQERKAAMKTAEEFLKQMNYSSNTQVSVCGNELARKKKLKCGSSSCLHKTCVRIWIKLPYAWKSFFPCVCATLCPMSLEP